MKTATVLSILVLLVSTVPSLAGPGTDTRLEGRVLGLDGRPAAGYRVHLIDDAGDEAVLAAVDDEGAYRMHGVDAGRYSLALETPDGLFAAVDGPGVRVREGHLVQRDFKLLAQDPNAPGGPEYASTRFGTWWAGLDHGARAWTIVAIVVVAGVTYEALSSDESPASETLP
jgi:hypothetical protein